MIPVVYPENLLDAFNQASTSNGNIETIGILYGSLIDGIYNITKLVIPQQEGTLHSCIVTTESELRMAQENQDSIVLGWIHTHPCWDVFMSSVDEHMQFAFQVQLQEAIAIIMNPSTKRYSVSNLTAAGIDAVRKCSETSVSHEHIRSVPYYKDANHCFEASYSNLAVVDWRHEHTSYREIRRLPWTRHHVCNSSPTVIPRFEEHEYSQRRDEHGYSQRQDEHGYSQRRNEHGYSQRQDEHEYSQRQDDINGDIESAKKVMKSCNNYIKLERLCSHAVVSSKKVLQALCQLENSLIDSCCSSLTDGFSYAALFLVKNSILYTRHMDHGILSGSWRLSTNMAETDDNGKDHIRVEVMTHQDLHTRSVTYQERLQDKRKEKERVPVTSGRKWCNVVHKNLNSVQNAHRRFMESCSDCNQDDLKLLGTCVILHKKEAVVSLLDQQDVSKDVQLVSGVFQQFSFVEQLNTFRLTRQTFPRSAFKDLVLKYVSFSQLTMAEQAEIINSISNDPTPTGRQGVRFASYFSVGGERNPPESQRNRLLNNWWTKKEDLLYDLVSLMRMDSQSGAKRCQPVASTSAARTKKLKYSPVEPAPPCTSTAVDESCNFTSQSAHDKFVRAILEKGRLSWRVHGEVQDVFVMNDVDLKTGNLMLNSFVQVKRFSNSFTCQCQMFTMLMNSDENGMCMHIKFIKEFVQDNISQIFSPVQADDSFAMLMLKKSTEDVNLPIIRLDCHKVFHRFSVLTADHPQSCSIVTLEKNRFHCRSGMCGSKRGHVRKEQRLGSGDDCPHLLQLAQHREVWQKLIPGFHDIRQETSHGSDSESEDSISDDSSVDEEPPKNPQKKKSNPTFNAQSGLWESSSISQHVPRDQDDPVLIDRRNKRLAINREHPDYEEDEQGYILRRGIEGLHPLEVKPSLDPDALCNCQKRYCDEMYPDGRLKLHFPKPVSLYLEQGVSKLLVYDRQCLNLSPDCLIPYCGRQDGIHIWSSCTAAGDELGWTYYNLVMNSHTSISCFHKLYKCKYEGLGSRVEFMSRTTLTDWLFSWMANFKIDFRQQCYICGENPKVLAGDGTMVGVLFRHAEFTPIENEAGPAVLPPGHRRTDRQFFCYSKNCLPAVKAEKRLAKEDLNYFIYKAQSDLDKFMRNHDSKRTEEERLQNVAKHAPEECKEVLLKFMKSEFPCQVQQSLANILVVCVTEKPISSLVNSQFTPLLTEVCTAVEIGVNSVNNFESLSVDLPEFYALYLSCQMDNNVLISVNSIVKYFVAFVDKIHKDDPVTPPVTYRNIYNPEEHARAYYFTKHGGQLRDVPHDKPNLEECNDGGCKKFSYATSSKSGSTYLYLIFDPVHYGHCYGFHLIENEGAKDAFLPLYLYNESAPKAYFCDNGCIVEEYALNRQPRFFKSCRFFHDVFHGYHHRCPYTYNSKRIATYAQVNTEICEQFNAYIQKIKFSGRAMSQSHFIFYLQFFIHQWNEMKKKIYQKQIDVIRSFQR